MDKTTEPPFLNWKVSVICTTFNSAHTIQQTVKSVLNQSFPIHELIIVDDASTDCTQGTLVALEKNEEKISIELLQKNSGGPAHPRNVGVELSQGDWIAFIDADDLWHKDKMLTQMYHLWVTGAKSCSTQMAEFRKVEDILPCEIQPELSKIEFINLYKQLLKYRTPTSSLVVEKDLQKSILFDTDNAISGKEDLLHSLDLHTKEKMTVKVKRPLVFYRVHASQISRNKLMMTVKQYRVFNKFFRKSSMKFFLANFFLLTSVFLYVYFRLIKRKL